MASWLVGDHHTPYLFFFYQVYIIILFFLLLMIISPSNPLSFEHPTGFKQGDVNLQGDASLLRSDIQVTVSSWDQNNTYSVGHVTSLQPMHLWDMASRNLTDFSTNFSFIIYSTENLFGDGLTFFLADPNLPLLQKVKEGGGLGLVDGDQVLNSTQHSFVGVEFDTYSNSWDPSGTHVGLNFNSMMSNTTNRWSDSIDQRNTYFCSIDYNSSTHNFSISYTRYNGVTQRLEQNNLSYKVDLRDLLPEWVMVGFSAATGDLFEVHTLQSWSLSSSLETPPSPNLKRKRNIGVFVGIGVGVPVVIGFIGLVFFFLWKWKWKKTDQGEEEKEESDDDDDDDLNMDDEFQKGSGPKKFLHDELVNATNNFAESEKLGHGGFGGVYRGFLKDQNSYVAIKRISRESKQGMKEYATEVKIISQLRHKNLVKLIGWCHKKKDFLLIYEFMPNGSLDSHLYHGKSFLTWEVRYKIALDLASALLYLHEEREQCVIHRDIKSSNIMLDSNFNAKLGDFGLARLVDHEEGSKTHTQTTHVAGTMGYIAPEYVSTGKASKQSDLYSFGVVLLEIASGRKPININLKEGPISIVNWAWELYGLGKTPEVADPRLSGDFDGKQMKSLVVLGIWCAHPDHKARPSIMQVIQVLKFEAPLPSLPHQMPVPTFLPPTMNAVSSSLSSPNWSTS